MQNIYTRSLEQSVAQQQHHKTRNAMVIKHGVREESHIKSKIQAGHDVSVQILIHTNEISIQTQSLYQAQDLAK